MRAPLLIVAWELPRMDLTPKRMADARPSEKKMLSHQLRKAVTDCQRSQLPRVSSAIWKAYAAGRLSDAEAETLSALIETRKIGPAPKPGRHRIGSQPRTPESLQRCRRWAAAGRMPPKIAAHFTMGEGAVLALIGAEVTKRGDCRSPIGQIAAVAGVCVSTARNALRKARVLGLLTSEERRLTHRRNDSNIVLNRADFSGDLNS